MDCLACFYLLCVFRHILLICLFCLLCFPLRKFPLSFLAFVKSENVGENATSDDFNLTLWNIRIVNKLFASTQ